MLGKFWNVKSMMTAVFNEDKMAISHDICNYINFN